MSKEVKILNRKLRWHDGVGISYEADHKHAEAIIHETGASTLKSLKVHMFKESKDSVRDRTNDIVKKRKLGVEEQRGRTDVERCRNHSVQGQWQQTANFFAIGRGETFMYCAEELTRHMATPSTADWEQVVRLGRYLKKRAQGSVVVHVSRDAVPT